MASKYYYKNKTEHRQYNKDKNKAKRRPLSREKIRQKVETEYK